jgi:HprK-related kinase A
MIQEKTIIRAGRFAVEVKSPIKSVIAGINQLYVKSHSDFCDFHIEIQPRRLVKRQAIFSFNGLNPFSPLPIAHAFPLLEWGMNWCVTQNCHQYLLIHAAVVEKYGQVIIMPGCPGAGKSTLCAALVAAGGWTLYSDELALIDPINGQVLANPRPVSLKNKSIDIIKNIAPNANFSPRVHDTIKGTVAHMKPEGLSFNNFDFDQSGKAAYVIFPKFQKDKSTLLSKVSLGNAFIRMAENSFNYHVLGREGFSALSLLMEQVKCYDFEYDGDLGRAIALFDDLVSL